jgi:DNA-binding NtrC family response regulator
MVHPSAGTTTGQVVKIPAMTRRRQRTILLVDNDLALGCMIKDHLTEEDFEVIHVHDSMVALGLLETGRKFDLLLTDIAMPEGMPHGVSLALMARRHVQDVVVVFMTGHPDVLEIAGELPGKAFVKPVDLAELTQEIRRALQG